MPTPPIRRTRSRVAPRAALALALMMLAGAAAAATADAPAATTTGEPAAPGPVVTEVKVERIRPKREKHPTLRFLKENRDFIRARFDLLREKPDARRGSAEAIDPRLLAYQRLLAEILVAQDSVAVAEEARRRQELFASVTELGGLEARLDLMERLLAEQRARLAVLQEDFTGRQRTALAIVLSGYPGDAAVSAVAITLEGGGRLSVPLSAEQRESLQRGGMLQVFHALVEPREQVIEVAIGGDRWPAGNSGFVTLEPARDRLTFLQLNLTPVQPAQGASSILANTWVHDSGLPTSDGSESEP